MGLRETIQGAVQQGFGALGNVPEDCTYTRVSSGSYNITAGSPDTVESTAPCSVVFDEYDDSDLANSAIQKNDVKALIAAMDLAFDPALDDLLTRADLSVWTVVGIGTDPAGAHWALQMRRGVA